MKSLINAGCLKIETGMKYELLLSYGVELIILIVYYLIISSDYFINIFTHNSKCYLLLYLNYCTTIKEDH